MEVQVKIVRRALKAASTQGLEQLVHVCGQHLRKFNMNGTGAGVLL